MASDKKKMPYVRLGNSGLKVSKIILGCMSYGSPEWQDWVLGEEEGIKHIKAAYELGINTFDTANVYSSGLSEVVLGNAIEQLKLPREKIVVMTKVYSTVHDEPGKNVMATCPGNPDDWGYVNQHGLSRKHIFASVQASLKRLKLDYIDLLQCHSLHDVVQKGWVRYIGMSSCHAYQFHAMQNYAISKNLTPFISMQNHYSAIYREEEREMMPTLKMYGVGCIPWSPLGRGLLTRPWAQNKTTERGKSDKFLSLMVKDATGESDEKIVSAVEQVAKKKGVSMAQIAIAYLLHKPGVTAPIFGTTKLESVYELAAAVNITLDEADIKAIDEPYTPRDVFGHT
ncbi:aryl-alcohol dehydrogenase [Atractiella rhizophila]|nr:aryl-alcohol dehydrogenase [Atractiella rhizophila]